LDECFDRGDRYTNGNFSSNNWSMATTIGGNMKNRCADCKVWEYQKSNFGFCRLNAPFPTVEKGTTTDSYILVWPSTGRDDWCSQFIPARELEVVE